MNYSENNNSFELQRSWEQSAQTGSDSHFEMKKVKVPKGIKYRSKNGNPFITRYSTEGNLKSIEQIKRRTIWLEAQEGAIFSLHAKDQKTPIRIYLSEGVETALSIPEALEHSRCVVSAGSANNVAKCIPSIRKKNPQKEIEIGSVTRGEQKSKSQAKADRSVYQKSASQRPLQSYLRLDHPCGVRQVEKKEV